MIRKFQIVQDSVLSLRIDYVVYEPAIRIDIEKRLKTEIEKLFEENIRISCNRVNEIGASDSGKYQIVSKE